ncbi:MAG: sigma factor-like helix-turn-helix DNA-binding protein [Candidatus Aminicenantales bacterium]
MQGKSYEELAEILSLPLGTVKSRVNRARIQLAKVLKERRGGLS